MLLVVVLVIIRQLFWEIPNLITKRVPFQRKEIVIIKSNNKHTDTHPHPNGRFYLGRVSVLPKAFVISYTACKRTHIQLHIDDTFKHKILLGCLRCLNVQSILPCRLTIAVMNTTMNTKK